MSRCHRQYLTSARSQWNHWTSRPSRRQNHTSTLSKSLCLCSCRKNRKHNGKTRHWKRRLGVRLNSNCSRREISGTRSRSLRWTWWSSWTPPQSSSSSMTMRATWTSTLTSTAVRARSNSDTICSLGCRICTLRSSSNLATSLRWVPVYWVQSSSCLCSETRPGWARIKHSPQWLVRARL